LRPPSRVPPRRCLNDCRGERRKWIFVAPICSSAPRAKPGVEGKKANFEIDAKFQLAAAPAIKICRSIAPRRFAITWCSKGFRRTRLMRVALARASRRRRTTPLPATLSCLILPSRHGATLECAPFGREKDDQRPGTVLA
jgi:hypothetical protein